MALGTRELLLILRARDEASRTVHALSRSMRGLDRDARAAISAQTARGQALTSAGVGIASVGVAMAGALTDMTMAAVEYERQSALTFTQLDKTKGSVKEIEDIGKRVARAIPVPFEQVQTSLYDIFSSMDVSMKEAESLLTQFSKASVAGQVDLQEAARGTIGILNAYNLGADKVNHVNDVMFQLVRKGVGTYGEFARTIGRAIPSAVRAGQSVEDLAGMMAFLTRNGLSAAMASASAGRALDALSHPNSIKNLDELGVSLAKMYGGEEGLKKFGLTVKGSSVKVLDASGNYRKVADVMKDFGEVVMKLPPADRAAAMFNVFKGSGGTIQARRFFDIAVKQYPQLISLTKSMDTATGAMDGAYKTMSSTGASAIQSLKNNWEILKVEIGSALVPVLKTLTDWLKNVFDWWSKLSDGQKKAIGIVAAVVAALTILAGVVLVVAGGLMILAAGAAAIGIGMAPLIAIIAGVVLAVGGLIAGFNAFMNSSGPVVDIAKQLFQWMGATLKDAWNDLVEAIQPLLPLLKFVGAVLGGVLVVAMLAVVAGIKVLAWSIKWIVQLLAMLVEAIVGGAVKAWNTLYASVEWLVNGVVGFFQWLYDVLVGHSIIPDLVNGVTKWFRDMGQWVKDVWEGMQKAAVAIWNNIYDFFRGINKRILDTILSFANTIEAKWKTFWNVVRALWNVGVAYVRKTWNDFLTNLRTAWDTLTKPISKKITDFVNGIKTAFTNAKTNITKIWTSIQAPLKVPVNFMIGLYNNGIAGMANKLASFVGIKARMPLLNKFAAGGVLPGYTPGRDIYTAPMAAFSGGEAIMRPEFTRAMGSNYINQANSIAKNSGVEGVKKFVMGGEGLAFANGGIIQQRFAGGGILEKIGNFIKGVKDFAITNIKKAGGALLDKIFGGALPGGGVIKELLTALPGWMKDVFLKWMADKVSFFGGGGTGFKGKGAPQALAFARAQAGKPYVWGGVGPGGYDCSGFMSAIQNVIRGRSPYSRLYSTRSFGTVSGPDGMVRNFPSGFMVGVTNAGVGHMAGTLNGVNVESRGSAGVVVGSAARGFNNSLFGYRYGLKYDNGGYLEPGMTLAMNKTGSRERVLDAAETAAYERKGSGNTQIFNIFTHEINPRKNAAELGWELERRSAP